MLMKAQQNSTELSTFTFSPNASASDTARGVIPTFHDIRVVTIDDAPWFVAADVCKALGYCIKSDGSVNTGNAVRPLRADEVAPYVVRGKGAYGSTRNQLVKCVSESGLYKLVLRSDKPEAKAFQDWVTREVLPSIRKHGVYSVDVAKAAAGEMSFAEMELRVMEGLRSQLQEEQKKNLMLETAVGVKDNQIMSLEEDNASLEAVKAEMEPLVERYQAFIGADGTFTKESAAKILGFPSAIKLNLWLHHIGVQYPKYQANGNLSHWLLYAAEVRQQRFVSKTSENIRWGKQVTIRVSPKGLEWLRDYLQNLILKAPVGIINSQIMSLNQSMLS